MENRLGGVLAQRDTVLPYAEILAAEDTKAIIIDTLLNELYRLERYKELLDVAVLKQEIQARFEIEMTV